MPTMPTSKILQHLCGALSREDEERLTDGQLLGCFIEHRSEAAFAALLRRLGPMVLGVCRRVLRDRHDAEDAFQATFLVLLRKVTGIKSRETVANWLYGVAYNTALKARALAARRRAKEAQVAPMAQPQPEHADDWREWQPVLD